MNKKLLFSVTAKDCVWEYCRGSGKGGQNRNKRDTAVTCRHISSGAVGQSEDERSQRQNRESAFRRMAESKKFKDWLKIESMRMDGILKEVEEQVEKEMRNIKVEVKVHGLWVEGLDELQDNGE